MPQRKLNPALGPPARMPARPGNFVRAASLIALCGALLAAGPCGGQSLGEMREALLNSPAHPQANLKKTELAARLAAMLEPAMLGAGREMGVTIDPRKALLELSPVLHGGHFPAAAKAAIERSYRARPDKEHILLAGLVDVPSARREIAQLSELPIQEPAAGRFYGAPPWAACLVKARGGDQPKLHKLLQAASRAEPHTQVTVLLDELAYVPHPEVVAFLARFLASDARLAAVSPGAPGQRHADFAAAALARMLEGFPAPYKEDRSYSAAEIQGCRAWMAAQSSWKFRCHDGGAAK